MYASKFAPYVCLPYPPSGVSHDDIIGGTLADAVKNSLDGSALRWQDYADNVASGDRFIIPRLTAKKVTWLLLLAAATTAASASWLAPPCLDC